MPTERDASLEAAAVSPAAVATGGRSQSPALKLAVLGLVSMLAIVALALEGPIRQPAGYHDFADHRSFAGVPNFGNVASNLGFLVVGFAGLWALRREVPRGGLPELLAAYRTFFAGVVLVAFGSAYYHWQPSDGTLVWDRLPMTIAFMAFFAVILGEHIEPSWGRRLLVPLLALGIASVVYWQWSESAGREDLRFYVLVQYLPILLTPLILLLLPSRLSSVRYLWALLGAYAVAKVLEATDAAVLSATGAVSGHTLKHLAAAAGMYGFLLALRERRRL